MYLPGIYRGEELLPRYFWIYLVPGRMIKVLKK
jgi:hypothetical protein